MPKLDLASIPVVTGSTYPSPFDQPCRQRENHRIGQAAGLTQFGVNLTRLLPGAWSSQRHWHQHEDEFVWVLAGEVVLITDQGEQVLRAGECAGFPAGVADGHHFVNRSAAPVELLTMGSRVDADYGEYSDIDMVFRAGRYSSGGSPFAHKDGTPY